MKATRPDSWRLVKSERRPRQSSVVPIPEPTAPEAFAHTAGPAIERRLALFYSTPEVRDAFQSLSSEGIEIDTFEIARFARGTGKDRRRIDTPEKSWKKGQRFEAIFVEQSGPARSFRELMRWLRKTVPEIPILAYSSPAAAKEQSGVSLHLTELPRSENLPLILSDALA